MSLLRRVLLLAFLISVAAGAILLHNKSIKLNHTACSVDACIQITQPNGNKYKLNDFIFLPDHCVAFISLPDKKEHKTCGNYNLQWIGPDPATSKSALLQPIQEIKPLPAATIIPVAEVQPVADNTCDQSQNVYCYGVYGVDQYGTPIPKVKETQPAQPWVRSDGYFNYCYQMPDGSWTTVIGKLDLSPGVYYYGGSIDQATQAPAYADQSQAWCASHVPATN